MTIQEKVREGIKRITHPFCFDGEIDFAKEACPHPNNDFCQLCENEVGQILTYLHSQGGELKVKCPDCAWSQFAGEKSVGMTPCHSCNSTGYLVEPLIEEG